MRQTCSVVVLAFRPGLDILPSAPSRTWPEYIGVWHFSEASGSARDSSGNGYHKDHREHMGFVPFVAHNI